MHGLLFVISELKADGFEAPGGDSQLSAGGHVRGSTVPHPNSQPLVHLQLLVNDFLARP